MTYIFGWQLQAQRHAKNCFILDDFEQFRVFFTWQQRFDSLALGFESSRSPAKFAKRFESSNPASRIRLTTIREKERERERKRSAVDSTLLVATCLRLLLALQLCEGDPSPLLAPYPRDPLVLRPHHVFCAFVRWRNESRVPHAPTLGRTRPTRRSTLFPSGICDCCKCQAKGAPKTEVIRTRPIRSVRPRSDCC
jgi:hypothetical protein